MNSSLTAIEALYVIDTNALMWHLTDDSKLGKQAAHIFDAAERGETQLLISSIVLAELYYANKKYQFFSNFNNVYQQLQLSPYIRFIELAPKDVLDFDVDVNVPEMHDRIITGLARRLDAPLLTSDRRIAEANLVTIVWD